MLIQFLSLGCETLEVQVPLFCPPKPGYLIWFLPAAGNLALSGPLLQNGGAHLRCCVGDLCRVDIRGNNLSHQNRISVHRHTCSSSSRIKLPGILGSGSPTRGNPSQYELGILASGHIEALAICWRPRKESLGVLYGYLHIFGPLYAHKKRQRTALLVFHVWSTSWLSMRL